MSQTLLFLVLQLLCVGLYAQSNKKFFRKDYTYIEETDSFYKIHTIPQVWDLANAKCVFEGATFFYPENEAEANAVTDLLKKTYQIEWVSVGISIPFVQSVFETIDNTFIADGYNKWDVNQPNNENGNEFCVSMNRDGFLNDIPCEKLLPFICKKKRSMLEWNQLCNIPNMDYSYNRNLKKCYKFHLQLRYWTDAYYICHTEQSNLAVIDSPAKFNYLKELTKKTCQDTIGDNYLNGAVFIGYPNKSSIGWMNVIRTNLKNSGCIKWGNQQPIGGDKERCGSIAYSVGLNDNNCPTEAYFICEHDVDISSDENIIDFQIDERSENNFETTLSTR